MNLKKAFTLIELIFVIILLGIVAMIAISSFSTDNRLQEATDQVIRHIRYTQHLAMLDDKFTPRPDNRYSNSAQERKNSQYWYKKYWQLRQHNIDNCITYTIFSDQPSVNNNNFEYDNNPNLDSIAPNPIDNSKLLSGGYAGFDRNNPRATQEMDLTTQYSIDNITFTQGCPTQAIVFDNLGRLFQSFQTGNANHYSRMTQLTAANTNRCLITLRKGTESSFICIEPYTGYARQVNAAADCP